MEIRDILTLLLLSIGGVFMLVAAVGVLRMPDFFMRMAASTKAGTLGAGCIMTGIIIYFDQVKVTTEALAIIVFLMVTAPVAAHVLGRAGYVAGVPLWDRTLADELHGRYKQNTRELSSPEELAEAGAGGEAEAEESRLNADRANDVDSR